MHTTSARKCTKLWKQRDGSNIRVCDMTDSHLLNTMRLLERKAEEMKRDMPYPCFQGEMAQMYAEQEWEVFTSSDVEDIYPIYEDMAVECSRRGLKL